MKDDKLFITHYEPMLVLQEIDNVVLRLYTHILGFATDDPDNSTKLVFTPRSEVDSRLTEFFAESGVGRGMSITSIASHKEQPAWLFLLDCAIPVSDENERKLIEALHASRASLPALRCGMVLRTQNSYHVVGFVPLSKEEWERHMALAILLRTSDGAELSDVRYIGHSLERGYGSLRLSDYLGKPTPDFVCYL